VTRSQGRAGAGRIALLRVGLFGVAVLVAVVATTCTPEEYQRWWTGRGNPPLAEPRLSRAADDATRFWEEVARRNRFTAEVHGIDGALAARMTPTSWRPGCPVPLSSLRYLRLGYVGTDGREHVGELVVHASEVLTVVAAFHDLWNDRFPIARMQLVDDFGGSDDASTAADNTSAFNCRSAFGNPGSWSEHAFGRAIDINPVENPYVATGVVTPAAGMAFLDRRNVRPGMLTAASAAPFTSRGWGWGGTWSSATDYQHVSASGR
jgi:hypothetical protein